MDNIEKTFCVVCGNTKNVDKIPLNPNYSRYFDGEKNYQWFSCHICKAQFCYPRETADYDEIYTTIPSYKAFLENYEEEIDDTIYCKKNDRLYRSIMYYFLKLVPFRGNFLDFGTGNGALVKLASKLGFNAYGVEISDVAREFIKSNLQITTFSSLEEVMESGMKFNVITALEVIEHVEFPVNVIKSLKNLLTQDGYLIISVPNLNRPYWRFKEIGKEREVWLNSGAGDAPPHHLTRFNRHTLELALKMGGFTNVVAISTLIDCLQLMYYGLGIMPRRYIQHFINKYLLFPFQFIIKDLGFGLIAVGINKEEKEKHDVRRFLTKSIRTVKKLSL